MQKERKARGQRSGSLPADQHPIRALLGYLAAPLPVQFLVNAFG